jgi:hypothetical protein
VSNRSKQNGKPKIREGQPRTPGYRSDRTSRYAFGGADPYNPKKGAPRLQFGERGELTPRTIEQADLTPEEKERAYEMLMVQAAYLEIYDCLDYPTDPDGHIVDLAGIHMTQPKVAIAWTLALNGFRRTDKQYIKKRYYSVPGVIEGAYTWVDSYAPENAAEELTPQMKADDHRLPPDTRRLAAIRDGEPGQKLPDGWSVTPKITYEGFDDR